MASEAEDDDWNDLHLNDDDLKRLLDEPLAERQDDNTSLRTNEQHAGFDMNAGDNYIYPSNLPCRSYQLSITKAALFRNTLVVLPTGLGKTFIAAVVMYNLYRWYPTGKVIFMAPTRPLVAQQIEACKKIMPFPQRDTVELTGKIQHTKRIQLWRTKRVFFATPQVVQSDIVAEGQSSEFPFAHVKLIVVDEAHRAKGRYAYTEVVQTIAQHNRYFRVLALSATPGRTMEDVAEVIRNLFISHLEVRWEHSFDVQPYVHQRQIKTIVIPLGDEIKRVRNELLQIIDPYMRQLIDAGVLSGNLSSIHRNFLLFEQKRFRERSMQQRHPQQSTVTTNFSICISLYHALELLERHGLRVFLNNFEPNEEGRSNFVLTMNPSLNNLIEDLRQKLGPNPFDVSAHTMTNGQIAEMPKDLDFGHPKFEHARTCLMQHFQEHPDSRAIVFCEYRESVMLMYRLLLQHVPLLKPRCFVGQGNAGPLRALTQKQQIQIMNDFRGGKSNILIATSVAEEGIDVGEVDLIICFDISTANPTRFVQRIGRTGRKKHGKVLMLVTEGREQQLLQDVLKNKDQTNKKLLNSTVVKASLYKHSPRLVPTELNPQCVNTFVKPPEDDEEQEQGKGNAKQKITKKVSVKSNTKKQAQAPIEGSQDLRKFFKQTKVNLCEQEMAAIPTQLPGANTQKYMEEKFGDYKEFFKELEMPASNTAATFERPDVHKVAEPTPPPPDAKELREFNKFLRSTADIVPLSQRTDDFLTQIKSNILSAETKLLMLKLNPDFVRKSYENMKILSALGLELEVDSMSKEEKELREAYDIVEHLFESKEAIENFLDDNELQQEKEKLLKDAAFEEDDLDMSDEEFEACLDKIFDGLEDLGMCCDNFDYIQRELKKTQRYQDIIAAAEQQQQQLPPPEHQERNIVNPAAESMIYDTMQLTADEDMDEDTYNGKTNFSITDSKYCSQWDEFAKRELPNKSTPIQAPILKAFQRQANKTATKVKLMERLAERRESTSDDDVINLDVSSDDDDEIDADLICAVKNLEETVNASFASTSGVAAKKSLQNNDVDAVDSDGTPADLDLLANAPEKHDENTLKSNTNTDNILEQSTAENEKTSLKSNDAAAFDSDGTPDDLDLLANEQEKHEENTLKSNSKTENILAKEKTKCAEPMRDEHLLNELDFDMDAFLDPFPEEQLLATTTATPMTVSHVTITTSTSPLPIVRRLSNKENIADINKDPSEIATKYFNTNRIVDAELLKSTIPEVKNKSTTLAAKLATKCSSHSAGFKSQNSVNNSSTSTESSAVIKPPTFAPHETSPKRHQLISASSNSLTKYERSPSVFDMYKHKMSQRSKVQRSNIFRASSTSSADNNQLAIAVAAKNMNSPIASTKTANNSSTSIESISALMKSATFASHETSPKSHQMISAPSNSSTIYERSPSVFDMYKHKMSQRCKIQKLNIFSSAAIQSDASNQEASTVAAEDVDSPIVARHKTSKRKIFHSSSEGDNSDIEQQQNAGCKQISPVEQAIGKTTSKDEIVVRKKQATRNLLARRNRRHFCAFVEREAIVSGSDDEDEDPDDSNLNNLNELNSMIVASSDEEENAVENDISATQVHAMYLQSLKSPKHKNGAFKIPAPRVYNDHTEIFSQPVPIQNSQYEMDSFIDDEEESNNIKNKFKDKSKLCPLERAERILKEQRRARRRFAKVAIINNAKRQRICHIADNSSDEDN